VVALRLDVFHWRALAKQREAQCLLGRNMGQCSTGGELDLHASAVGPHLWVVRSESLGDVLADREWHCEPRRLLVVAQSELHCGPESSLPLTVCLRSQFVCAHSSLAAASRRQTVAGGGQTLRGEERTLSSSD